jgi:L-threonylcarbamoyladenylate synthase
MILYPTETIYALGVNALDNDEMAKLFELKGRDSNKSVSWLVRDIKDIKRYAEVSDKALEIAQKFLPGPLTLVLPALPEFKKLALNINGTLSFRISSDSVAEEIIAGFMEKYDAPLTCTSANISGLPTGKTVTEIITQFGQEAKCIDKIYDDGPRESLASTVVGVFGSKVIVYRQGAIKI